MDTRPTSPSSASLEERVANLERELSLVRTTWDEERATALRRKRIGMWVRIVVIGGIALTYGVVFQQATANLF